METNFNIVRDRDHYLVYVNGKFFCSADSVTEAMDELEKEGYVT